MKEDLYEKAGVPHLKGDPAFNRQIVKLIRSTHRPGVLGNPTGFASLFDLGKTGIKNPLIVTSTDGVGTKLEIARLQRCHDTIGIDLVAMCVNDIITLGARPVIFLDYFATGKFDQETTFQVLKGVARGCREAGCALVGGETAIMPGFYQAAMGHGTPEYDMAGFAVGVVDRRKVVTGERIRPGDQILGMASSGFHSNGYSLLRKIFSKKELSGPLGKKLLVPTRIYVKPVLDLIRKVRVGGIANITGGGFIDNIPRVLPEGLQAQIDIATWPQPKIFEWVEQKLFKSVKESVKIPPSKRSSEMMSTMMHTFNMGIGMVLILRPSEVRVAQAVLKHWRLDSWVIGGIMERRNSGPQVVFEGGEVA